ncbi:MAG TPA: hypothetical protein VFP65_29890 [Anaeromyxobacteraceae bacterium]|nr:hypothetical protein [Anaeromyxobacteraceae bacterium]
MPPSIRARLAWAGALVALLAGTAAAMEWHGRSSRTTFTPPGGPAGGRWFAVQDAGDAIRVLAEGGAHGRVLVLFSGRWPDVRASAFETDVPGAPQRPDDQIDADTATVAAARLAIARELRAVLLPAAYEARRAQVQGAKGFSDGDGWFDLPFHGYPRRFSSPEAFAAPPEPAIAVVEPSFFGEGAPPDLAAFAAARGLRLEVGLVALADPAATPAQRERAAGFAQRSGAVALEVRR